MTPHFPAKSSKVNKKMNKKCSAVFSKILGEFKTKRDLEGNNFNISHIMAGHEYNNTKENEAATENDTDITDPEENSYDNMSEEYYLLDSKLDELNTALDFLEKRTDDINEKLKELLQSNISIREELRNENMKATDKQ